jgi:hypothetical protein
LRISCISTFNGVFASRETNPSLRLTLKTWVSTAIVAFPKATACTTLAVFLPTPGRRTSWAGSDGTSPPYSATSIFAI